MKRVFISSVQKELPKPEVAVRGGTFHIAIRRKARNSVPVSVPVNVPVNVPVKMTAEKRILAVIASAPGLNRVALSKMLGIDVRTVGRYLSKLKGMVEFRGAPKTGGYYVKGSHA